MWQRDWGVWGGGKTEEETREAKIKYYWGNILTVLMLHTTVFRYSHFQSTAACPSNRDASTFWQKKKKSLRFSPPDCARRGWAARWVHFPLPASICIYSADSPCSAESQLGLISKALYTRFQLRFLMADIYIFFFSRSGCPWKRFTPRHHSIGFGVFFMWGWKGIWDSL